MMMEIAMCIPRPSLRGGRGKNSLSNETPQAAASAMVIFQKIYQDRYKYKQPPLSIEPPKKKSYQIGKWNIHIFCCRVIQSNKSAFYFAKWTWTELNYAEHLVYTVRNMHGAQLSSLWLGLAKWVWAKLTNTVHLPFPHKTVQ